MKQIMRYLKVLRRYLLESRINKGQRVKVFNDGGAPEYKWFRYFIERNNLFPSSGKDIFLFCTYSRVIEAMSFCQGKPIIYYTSENIHVKQSPWNRYEHLFLSDKKINLSIGFDYIDHPKYVRFPYWIIRHLRYSDTIEDIKRIIDFWNCQRGIGKKTKTCAFVCRNDYFGDRAILADLVEKVVPINYPSQFRHNDDDLFSEKFQNNKIDYLRQFKFNLCPENSNSEGYVTEKLFDAFSAGCIPIYWGSNNTPEPGIINPDAIIFLSLNGDNTEALKKIKLLNENEAAYNEFISQPIFTKEAPDLIWKMFQTLEDKIKYAIS